ncbi:MAG: hypothetical protein JWP87_5269 [Labilithrix sp.]|nr:hypothetical protein [Labilithrix sp.]
MLPVEGRIVICFRTPGSSPGAPGRSFLERARALDARARALGAVVVAWDAGRVSFAFDGAKLAHAIGLATQRGDDTIDDEAAWSVGIAQGDLKPLADDGSHGDLAWGAPLVAASVLSQVAQPGEVLCSQTVRGLRSGELLTAGSRVGRDGTLRVRGVRLDAATPWRKQAVEQLSHMRVAPLVGAPPPPTQIEPGSLLVLRADPGTGGTRYITELASRASRALVVVPSGSSFEPLGALRRALARSLTRELSPLLLELAEPLEALLAGEGVGLDTAARLVTAFLWPKTEAQGPGLLFLDDAKTVDPATLEACVRAAQDLKTTGFGVVARLDATSGLPSVLAALGTTTEIEIAPLSRDAAESLAGGCTNDALDVVSRRRWARLAAHLPLGVVESVAYGITTGDLRWTGERASPRSRASGRGKVRGAADWILLRAREESPACRLVLCLVALLGGEAKTTRLGSILERAGERIDIDAVLEELVRGRWLVDTQEDWVALPSRTHRDALSGLVDADARTPLHRGSAEVIQTEEGVFGRVEAAWHAAQAGDGPASARILLAAARATAAARLEASTTQLIAFARRADPSCEEAALELLANALERAPSVPPPQERSVPPRSVPPHPRAPQIRPSVPSPPRTVEPEDLAAFEVDTSHDSEPPTIAKLELAPMAAMAATPADVVMTAAPAEPVEEPEAGVSSGANIATRLGELAKDALLSADNAALERWVDGLRAAGESPLFTERLRALSRLGRGDIGDALRVLRRTRSALDPNDHNQRCQTSLAIGVALSVAGRAQEALLEGMDALARARHVGDARGAAACLAFLAKLYTAQGRVEAETLRVTAAP